MFEHWTQVSLVKYIGFIIVASAILCPLAIVVWRKWGCRLCRHPLHEVFWNPYSHVTQCHRCGRTMGTREPPGYELVRRRDVPDHQALEAVAASDAKRKHDRQYLVRPGGYGAADSDGEIVKAFLAEIGAPDVLTALEAVREVRRSRAHNTVDHSA